jgi:hypothetical protein
VLGRGGGGVHQSGATGLLTVKGLDCMRRRLQRLQLANETCLQGQCLCRLAYGRIPRGAGMLQQATEGAASNLMSLTIIPWWMRQLACFITLYLQ